MGSDWANLTVEPVEKMPPVASARQPEPVERVTDYVSRECGNEALLPTSPPTVQLGQGEAREIADRIFRDCRAASRVLIVFISDSTHAGHGELYDDGGKIDEWSGWEGANGADVVGWFKDNYDINGSYADPW